MTTHPFDPGFKKAPPHSFLGVFKLRQSLNLRSLSSAASSVSVAPAPAIEFDTVETTYCERHKTKLSLSSNWQVHPSISSNFILSPSVLSRNTNKLQLP